MEKIVTIDLFRLIVKEYKNKPCIYVIDIDGIYYKFGLTVHCRQRINDHDHDLKFRSIVGIFDCMYLHTMYIIEGLIKEYANKMGELVEQFEQTEIIKTENIEHYISFIKEAISSEISKPYIMARDITELINDTDTAMSKRIYKSGKCIEYIQCTKCRGKIRADVADAIISIAETDDKVRIKHEKLSVSERGMIDYFIICDTCDYAEWSAGTQLSANEIKAMRYNEIAAPIYELTSAWMISDEGITLTTRFAKHKLAIEFVKLCGYDGLHDNKIISRDAMIANLDKNCMIFNELAIFSCDLIARKFEPSGQDLEHILLFINGLLMSTYGISIKSTKRKRKERLRDEFAILPIEPLKTV